MRAGDRHLNFYETRDNLRDRLRAVCQLTDVELVEVPHQYAALR